MTTRILVVDDDEAIRKLLQARFMREGWTAKAAEDGKKALELAREFDPQVILTDIKMPGLDGFQLIDEFRASGFDCPIVMITGHGEKECAIEALHKGAFDYLEKPFDMDAMVQIVRHAIERDELRRANKRLLAELEDANKKLSTQLEVKTELLDRVIADASEEIMIGRSQHVQGLKEMVSTFAESFSGDHDPVVLITGESGVGKEIVARYMHSKVFRVSKQDAKRPFVAINCAAFPDNLLESELFGYEKGAFTGAMSRKLGLFELASGGTLFLDEIGEMDLKMQAKLLRALQERVIRRLGGTADISVRPQIITATNRDLAKMVETKTFREDLYYRLNTLPIAIAPLRSRVEDIETLANHFLNQLTMTRGKKFSGFSANATRAMQAYRWPGNVRELRSVIERAVILEKGPTLELSHLRQEHLHAARAPSPLSSSDASPALSSVPQAGTVSTLETGGVVVRLPTNSDKSLSDMRKEIDETLVKQVLIQALEREHGNVSAVARALRLDRANLLRLMKRFHIEPELFRNKQAS